jgi:hypothetical protein
MKKFLKLPLYIGLGVFVLSIFVSVSKVQDNRSIADLQSRASGTGTILSLNNSSPGVVNVFLNSPNDVGGIDVTLKYDKNKIEILSSSLKGGTDFKTTGDNVDTERGTFSFSAIPRINSVKNGIVASFEFSPKEGSINSNTEISFVLSGDSTQVIGISSVNNILSEAKPVTFKIVK